MPMFHIPDVALHLIESKHVAQVYRVQVMQPLQKAGEVERFPALYLTDANLSFDMAKGISHLLQVSGQVRRYIVVGIGYSGENPFAGSILRCRDFTSPRRPAIADLPRSSPIAGVPGLEDGAKQWHGAAQFLAFIRDELIPLIEGTYPVIPGDRAYAGYSMGGGLGLHALFSQPDLFTRYLIASPSLSYDGNDYGLDEAREFIAAGKRLDARVFTAVGELEELDADESVARPRFVSSVCRLAALLRKAQIPGLDLSCRIFPGETHASVWPIAFTHGVQALYGPAAASPLRT
jgi:predicted alpha/beta superfamily hydrolase